MSVDSNNSHRTHTGLPKLGALPAVTYSCQPRLNTLEMMGRIAPPWLDRSSVNPAPIMGGNDALGDCTSVGLANSIRAVSALNGYQTAISAEDAISFYAHSTGYEVGHPETDRGGVEVDVLTYAATYGLKLENERLYPLWGSIDPDDLNGMRLAMTNLGPVYLGVQLAIADQATMGHLWDTEAQSAGDPTPGSWGGHCLLAWDYTGTEDTDEVTLLTWGTTQRATWRWLRSRMMEVHGLLWPQLATPGHGFLTIKDLETLRMANSSFLAGRDAA